MIEKGRLSDFNLSRFRSIEACNNSQISTAVNEQKYPLIYKLLTETTEFYTREFFELRQFLKREKRLVIFETPSRVSFTHEYTIEGAGGLSSGFHFLFNTTDRLSWLKIEMEGRRVSIASKDKVISLLLKKINPEITLLAQDLGLEKMNLAHKLYELSDGKPCFVEFNQKDQKGQQSLLFSVIFFDSIQNKESANHFWNFLSPLQEKLILYNYSTFSNDASAWIYFKAPKNFVLYVKNHANEEYIEQSKSNDEEITSLVLTPPGHSLNVQFDISIEVPTALKHWYLAMLYLSIVYLVIVIMLNVFYCSQSFEDKTIENINNCSFALMAALIATRGWLMTEEQVLKRISQWYTYLIVVFTALILITTFHNNFIKIIDKCENKITKIADKRNAASSLYQNSQIIDSCGKYDPPCSIPYIWNYIELNDTIILTPNNP